MILPRSLAITLVFLLPLLASAGEPSRLPGTAPLTWKGDLADRMMEGLHGHIEQKITQSLEKRARHWKRDCSSPAAYDKSIQPNRRRFQKVIGVVNPRVPVRLERFGDDDSPALVADTDRYRIYQIRWPVLDGVWGEGLLLEPKAQPRGQVIALPDADQTPEQLAGLAPGVNKEAQFARRFVENGFRVVVPTLIDRSDRWSGNAEVAWTNQPHREWIYRQAYHMGRHIIGYEVQKMLAVVDWFRQRAGDKMKIGVVGYGEGGLLAFYAAAVDPRIDACLVSGYFDSRQRTWEEPIYRNVWGSAARVRRCRDRHPDRSARSDRGTQRGRRWSRDRRRFDPADAAAARRASCPRRLSLRSRPSFAASIRCSNPASRTRDLLTGADGKTTGPGSPAALQAVRPPARMRVGHEAVR